MCLNMEGGVFNTLVKGEEDLWKYTDFTQVEA